VRPAIGTDQIQVMLRRPFATANDGGWGASSVDDADIEVLHILIRVTVDFHDTAKCYINNFSNLPNVPDFVTGQGS
jgi:hypothetical protein